MIISKKMSAAPSSRSCLQLPCPCACWTAARYTWNRPEKSNTASATTLSSLSCNVSRVAESLNFVDAFLSSQFEVARIVTIRLSLLIEETFISGAASQVLAGFALSGSMYATRYPPALMTVSVFVTSLVPMV